jgi:4-hydroxy-tetrahydrodipicolinate synthase
VAIKLVQYIKLANQIAGEGKEWVRPPRLPLVGEERRKIEDIVNHAIATRPKFAKAA